MERPHEENTQPTSIAANSSSVGAEPHFVTFLMGLCVMCLLFVRHVRSGVPAEQALYIAGKQVVIALLIVLGVAWGAVLGWIAVETGVTRWRARKKV